MLSVLIPVYNCDVTALVTELHRQCSAWGEPFEIVLIDDCSEEHYKTANQSLASMPYITYTELEQNIGRSAIRNRLISEAQFEYLILMDCDSFISSSNYITTYWENRSMAPLIYGGRVYPDRISDPTKLLRWKYGKEREQLPASVRKQRPHQYFLANNILAKRDVFEQVCFDESIRKYGYEDTVFAHELFKANIAVGHLDNPVLDNLENAEDYLTKVRHGIENLVLLYQSNRLSKQEVTLLRYYEAARKWKLHHLLARIFKLGQKLMEKHLLSRQPNLKWFDFYRLSYLCKVAATSS